MLFSSDYIVINFYGMGNVDYFVIDEEVNNIIYQRF